MAEPEFRNYDVREVTIVLADIPIDSGFAEGDVVAIQQNTEDFKVKVGADGSVTRFRTNDRTAKIKLRLMHTADANARLTELNAQDKAAPNGAGVGAFMCRDRQNGNIKYTAEHCWISKPPDATFGGEPGVREWELECADLVRVDG